VGLCLWLQLKVALYTRLTAIHTDQASSWCWGNSAGAGPAIVVAHALARATAAPLTYMCEYVVDDEDAKGEFYNWFAESTRLLGLGRVAFAALSGAGVAFALLPWAQAACAVAVAAAMTLGSRAYANATLGGVMGDYLGATICMTEAAVLMALAADPTPFLSSVRLLTTALRTDPSGTLALLWDTKEDAYWDAQAALPLAMLVGAALLPTLYGAAVRYWDRVGGHAPSASC